VSDRDISAEDDPAALDASWAEEPAFGRPAACGAAAQSPHAATVRFEAPPANDPKRGNRKLNPISA
jgi:hypothetical protein